MPFFFFLENMYLFYLAVLSLSCSVQGFRCITQDLSSWLTDSLVAACGLSFSEECRILVPDQGLNLRPLPCKEDS